MYRNIKIGSVEFFVRSFPGIVSDYCGVVIYVKVGELSIRRYLTRELFEDRDTLFKIIRHELNKQRGKQ